MGQRFLGFVCRRLQTSQAPQDEAHWAQRAPGPGRFDPRAGLSRGAIVGFGHSLAVLGTVGGLASLTGRGQQALDVWPSPLSPITDDAPAPLRFRPHAGLGHLLEHTHEAITY